MIATVELEDKVLKPYADLKRQHLIDPDICIRCNTCEETCPKNAVSHNDDNYVISFIACEGCGDCLDPCPTGAIRNWRTTYAPYTLQEQLQWLSLPTEVVKAELQVQSIDQSSNGHSLSDVSPENQIKAPTSSTTPHVNLYRRDRPATAKVISNTRVTQESSRVDVHHLVLQIQSGPFPVLEGQSVGIVPAGVDEHGKRLAVRQYSVASCRDGEHDDGRSFALTVKRVLGGLCSNQICDLPDGADLEVTGPFGATFLMPQDPKANLLMICTGTGVAPFRGFIERRQHMGASSGGQLLLFYGAQTPQDMPYLDWLQALPETFLSRELCFSRLGGAPKVHVQDRLRSCADSLRPLLFDPKTHLFICGLKGMESEVEQAFRDILQESDCSWEKLSASMRVDGRYHIETY